MIEVYDSLLRDRLYHLTTVADNLPSTVKYASLTMSERLRLNKLAADGLGAEMYNFITSLVDTRSGRAQDKLQQQFRECKVHPSDLRCAAHLADADGWPTIILSAGVIRATYNHQGVGARWI